MDIVERLQGMARMRSMTWVTADKSKRPANIYSEAADEIERLREALNGAYTERNRVVALLASVFPSGLKRTSIPDWDEEWNGCVYIDLPTGQASWHFHDCEAHLFSHLPPYEKDWDGHTTEEKYDRVSRSALQQNGSE